MVAALLLECLCAASARAAGADATFAVSRLSVADKVLDLLTEDLNNDGLKDIMVIHRKGLVPHETRWISIFWQNGDGRFATAADQSWEIDTTAVVIDVGDVIGDAKREIVCITPTDVRYYTMVDGSFGTRASTLFETNGLAVFPAKGVIPWIDFARDWNGDGRDEVGVFLFEGLAIFMPDPKGAFISRGALPMELDTRMWGREFFMEPGVTTGLTARYSFPDIRLVDFNADGRPDIVAAAQDKVMAYRQDGSGAFAAESGYRMDFDVSTQKEKLEEIATLQTIIADVNNDGYADAFVTKQIAKGLSSFRAVINIFNGGPGGYGKQPSQVIISEGTASARSFIQDVNGDNRLDLVLPSVKMSIAAIIRILITRSVPVYFNVFLLGGNGKFSERPDFSKEIKFQIDFSGDSDTQAMNLEGDYNGDKRRDFVFATGAEELSIYLGVKDGGSELFSKKPVAKVKANAFGDLSSPDLNGDGYSDMVIYYPESKDRWGTAEVLLNLRKIH
jgi:hypothetical protein